MTYGDFPENNNPDRSFNTTERQTGSLETQRPQPFLTEYSSGSSYTYSPDGAGKSRAGLWVLFGLIMAVVIVVVAFLAIQADTENSGALPQQGSGQQSLGQQDAGQQPSDDAAASGGSVQENPSADADPHTQLLAGLARLQPDDPMALGAVTAPVVIIEYADLNCSYCAQFSTETLPLIVENYVDAGLVRIEWRDLPLFGEPSTTAAVGGRIAAAQGKFWEFQEAYFAARIPQGEVTQESVTQVAESIGLQGIKFGRGFLDSAHLEAVEKDLAEAQHIGVQSTPTFLINGESFLGAQPYENFAEAIEAALAKVQ